MTAIQVGMFGNKPLRKPLYFGGRGLHIVAVRQARECTDAPYVRMCPRAERVGIVHQKGHVDFNRFRNADARMIKGETPRQHANDRASTSIEHQFAADDCAVRAEGSSPQTVGENQYVLVSRLVVLVAKDAPQCCAHSKQRKERCRHAPTEHTLGFVPAGHLKIAMIEERHLLEGTGPAANVEKFWHRRIAFAVHGLERIEQRYQPVCMLVRKGT